MTEPPALPSPGHTVRPIGPDTLPDLRALLGHPPEGWCWCVAWEVETWDGWAERSAETNRTLREDLWRQGEFHGFVFYLEDAPVGWCRVGPAATWPKLCRERGVPPDPALYAFTCFGMRPEHRRLGHLHRFLALVIEDLRAQGITRFVAVPRRLQDHAADGHAWNGPPKLFLKAGFRITAETERFFVVEL